MTELQADKLQATLELTNLHLARLESFAFAAFEAALFFLVVFVITQGALILLARKRSYRVN